MERAAGILTAICLVLASLFFWWAIQAAWMSALPGADKAELEWRFAWRLAVTAFLVGLPLLFWTVVVLRRWKLRRSCGPRRQSAH